MSLLTEVLNQIRIWIETNYPKSVVSIPPGLHISQIQEIVKPLTFELPNEVYQLYQWSCGIEEEASYDIHYDLLPFDPFDNFYLCNLKQIVNQPIFEDIFGN